MKEHYIHFYALLDSKGNFETIEDEPVINVGISTNPEKHLRSVNFGQSKTVFVLLVKHGEYKTLREALNQLDEIRAYKDQYYFEPLALMIKNKCKEIGFKPYKMINSKKTKKEEQPSHKGNSALTAFF